MHYTQVVTDLSPIQPNGDIMVCSFPPLKTMVAWSWSYWLLEKILGMNDNCHKFQEQDSCVTCVAYKIVT